MFHEETNENLKHHPRAVLTATQAIEIYSYRKTKSNCHKKDPLLTGRSAAVAKKFNVSPKAIRDIWNRRTWTQETQHLWTDDEHPMIRQERLRKGSLTFCSQSARPSCMPTPYSPECVIDCCDAWRLPDYAPSTDGCSVYTNDSEQQSHFHSLSLWSQLLHSRSTIPYQGSAAHPPTGPFFTQPEGPSDAAASALPLPGIAAEKREEEACASSPMAEVLVWREADAANRSDAEEWSGAAEWSDAGPYGSAGAPDPFSLDWPTW
jgi:hypothetical protein